MILCNPSELLSTCPPPSTLLGIDLGTKTIGVALSDLSWRIASPVTILKRKTFTVDARALFKICDQENVGGFVIGFPLNMNGTEGPRCQSTRSFSQNILTKRDLPILLWDERMSTMAVNRVLIDADMSRKKRGDVVDKLAASFILQGVLDLLSTHTPLS